MVSLGKTIKHLAYCFQNYKPDKWAGCLPRDKNIRKRFNKLQRNVFDWETCYLALTCVTLSKLFDLSVAQCSVKQRKWYLCCLVLQNNL